MLCTVRRALSVSPGRLGTAGIDTLILGCTHYPLLSGLIQLAMGENVTLVSSAEETAKELLRVIDIDKLQSAYRVRLLRDGRCCDWEIGRAHV